MSKSTLLRGVTGWDIGLKKEAEDKKARVTVVVIQNVD